MFKYGAVFLLVAVAIAVGENSNEDLEPNTKRLELTVERSQNLTVSEETTITSQLRNIYSNNHGNKVRAEKLALYLNQNNFCEESNSWNVLIIDDAWYDRHTFRITEPKTKFFAVKTHGVGYPEEIYVIFNECQTAEVTTPITTDPTTPTTETTPPTTPITPSTPTTTKPPITVDP